MKYLLSFASLLGLFLCGSQLLYWLVMALNLDGLAAFLVSCIPLLMVLTWTTMDDNERYLDALARNAWWGYSLILSVAGVAWLIGRGSSGPWM
ncbi:MAG: hypothetical protein OXG56_03220 [Gammaproteobacteria bacterium]|nr:hypothetical protein [Gammaproteobacteria bacterium]